MSFDAIGTRWQIDTEVPLAPALLQRIRSRVERFDADYSRFRPDSLVRRLAASPGTYRFPADAAPLFALYRRLYDATGGAVTPLVGGALEHLGYGADYRLRRRAGPGRVPEWDDVLTVDGSVLTTREPVLLDVGAAGKGFLVDLVAGLLTDGGVEDFVVDASGDLVVRGTWTERVGLEDPHHPGQVVGVAELTGAALCASATTRRSWGDGLHHIVDPGTGEPTTAVVATWVVHESCAVADGLATALFLAEPEQLSRGFGFRYVRMLADGRVQLSTDFDGELFD